MCLEIHFIPGRHCAGNQHPYFTVSVTVPSVERCNRSTYIGALEKQYLHST